MATKLYATLANCLANLDHAGRGIGCSMYGAHSRLEQRCFPPTKAEYDLAVSTVPLMENGTWPPILRNLRNALWHWWTNYDDVELLLRSLPRGKISDEWAIELSTTIDALADPLRCTLPDEWPRDDSMRLNAIIDVLLPSDWENGLEKLGPYYDRLRAIAKTATAASEPQATTAADDELPQAESPERKQSGNKSVSRPQLAQAAVIAHFLAHPTSEPTAEDIGNSVGLDAPTIRNCPAWKLHRRGIKKAADDAGDAADIGDVDSDLEELAGPQERGRDHRKLRRRT